MSTRCNIEIYDGKEGTSGAMLYHHSDGYPDFMLGKLDRFLKASYEYLAKAGYKYWGNSERVAAVLVALSIEDYKIPLIPFSTDRLNHYEVGSNKPYRVDGGIPIFQPCLRRHSDIEYVWKVYLLEGGKFEIEYEEVQRYT